jgi:valine dehydrogenase (NAD+)
VGGANNQLAGPGVDRALQQRGIVYAPDFMVNAGGIINIAEELTGYDRARAMARAAGIEETTARVLEAASVEGITPLGAAMRIARRRVAEAGGRRWEPGSPAAWTDGAPLRELRPRRAR